MLAVGWGLMFQSTAYPRQIHRYLMRETPPRMRRYLPRPFKSVLAAEHGVQREGFNFMARRISAFSAAVAAIVLIGALAALPANADPNNNTVKKLTKAVTVDGVLDHLEALQEVADDNNGNRAAG